MIVQISKSLMWKHDETWWNMMTHDETWPIHDSSDDPTPPRKGQFVWTNRHGRSCCKFRDPCGASCFRQRGLRVGAGDVGMALDPTGPVGSCWVLVLKDAPHMIMAGQRYFVVLHLDIQDLNAWNILKYGYVNDNRNYFIHRYSFSAVMPCVFRLFRGRLVCFTIFHIFREVSFASHLRISAPEEVRPLLVRYVFRDCELQSACRSHDEGPQKQEMLEGPGWILGGSGMPMKTGKDMKKWCRMVRMKLNTFSQMLSLW